MRRCLQKYVQVWSLLFSLLLLTSCSIQSNDSNANKAKFILVKQNQKEKEGGFKNLLNYVYSDYHEPVNIDLQEIKKRGKLVALTGYGHTSYFIYKGNPMGFDFELLQLLADELEVKLEIIPVANQDEIFDMLNRGEGDIIANNLTVTKDREQIVNFTIPYNYTRQVLVQRKPEGHNNMSDNELEKVLVRNPTDLISKNVYIRKNSSYYTRVQNLSEEIGGDINIVEVPGSVETEDLILKVSEGKIDYTVAEENIALVNSAYLPNIDVSTPISMQQRVAWAVRETSPELLEAVNKWITKIKKEQTYGEIYRKYFKNKRGADAMISCKKQATCKRSISAYDKLIQRYAEQINWDWRLLAALIYQESHFNPEAKSWAGASGLMQLMPTTAQIFGATDPTNPHQNLQAGIKYLKWLDNYWKKKVPEQEERLKFVLASYNAGQEHVADAQRLAKKYNKNPQVWDNNVGYFILQKAKTKYSTDPVVKYGYCRGQETFNYVNQILDRYEHYKKLISEEAL